jgi:hypothetical protein
MMNRTLVLCLRKWAALACLFAISSCAAQSTQNDLGSVQSIEPTPQEQNDLSLSDLVAGWTLYDEDPNLANEFLQAGIIAIKPGLAVNRTVRAENAYWSSVEYEICPGINTLADIVNYGTGNLPVFSWVQENGNYEVGKPSPKFEFEYGVAVLDDESVTSESITAGFNQFLSLNGDTCRFVSDMWFLSDDKIDSCITEFSPGYSSSCLRLAASKYAPGLWGNFISKVVYSNSGSPSLFSVTTSIPYETSDGGYKRDAMARKLYVLPNSNDVFEVTVRMSTKDPMVFDDNWTEVVMGLTDTFFAYVFNSLFELKKSVVAG